jgi:hypothetical protein
MTKKWQAASLALFRAPSACAIHEMAVMLFAMSPEMDVTVPERSQ